jgi:hypothetical protein
MSDHIDIRAETVRITGEEDRHRLRDLQHRLEHVEHLLREQTKLLHQILAREPNWYHAPVGASITVR